MAVCGVKLIGALPDSDDGGFLLLQLNISAHAQDRVIALVFYPEVEDDQGQRVLLSSWSAKQHSIRGGHYARKRLTANPAGSL